MSVENGKSSDYNSNPGYSNNPAFAQPVESERVSGWFERNQKNKPQSNSLGAAALVFMSGGMNIAWGMGYNKYVGATKYTAICWFMMAIIGAIVAAVLCKMVRRKIIFLVSTFLVTVNALILLTNPRTNAAIIAARHIDGFANGLIFVPAIIMAGEEAVKALRGMISGSIESMSFAVGIYLQIIFSAAWTQEVNNTFSIEQMRGILCLFYGVLGFVLAFFLTVESPVFFLERGQEQDAIDSLRRLQRPYVVTTEVYEQLQEHKAYIEMNKEMSLSESAIAGLPALLKLIFYRSLNSLTFCVWLNIQFTIASAAAAGLFAVWPSILFGTARWIGSLIMAFLLDSAGRKKPMLVSGIICGVFAIVIGVLFSGYTNIIDRMTAAMYILIVFQIFAGVFITSSSTYLCEAFPLSVKNYYIATAFSVEMLVQIILFAAVTNVLKDSEGFLYAFGSLFLVFVIAGILLLPETKYTTLREAQLKFSKLLTVQFN